MDKVKHTCVTKRLCPLGGHNLAVFDLGLILHIDCNSFYASCEVSLRPELKGKPVVVANYNEAGGGIILALSKEAKALGLKRGNPVFQVREVLEKHQVRVFPANLTKYVDISRRIVSIVEELDMVGQFCRYSVDEFFATIPEMKKREDIVSFVSIIKEAIEHGSGIPVSCGIANTYTLAKVATWYAKRYDGYQGICVLEEEHVEKADASIVLRFSGKFTSLSEMHSEKVPSCTDSRPSGSVIRTRPAHF